jgi:hypothetical protein
MKVKIFSRPWSIDLAQHLEHEINAFLAELSTDAVKQVDANIVAARTQDGDVKSEAIITIWHDPSSQRVWATGSRIPMRTRMNPVSDALAKI